MSTVLAELESMLNEFPDVRLFIDAVNQSSRGILRSCEDEIPESQKSFRKIIRWERRVCLSQSNRYNTMKIKKIERAQSSSPKPLLTLEQMQSDLKLLLASLSIMINSDVGRSLADQHDETLKQIYQLIVMVKDKGMVINGILGEIIEDASNQSKKLHELFFGNALKTLLDYISSICTILLLKEKMNLVLTARCEEKVRDLYIGVVAKIAQRPQELISTFEDILERNAGIKHPMIVQIHKRMQVFKDVVDALLGLKNNEFGEDGKLESFVPKYKHENPRQVGIDLLTAINAFGGDDYHAVHLQDYLYSQFLGVANREAPYVDPLDMLCM